MKAIVLQGAYDVRVQTVPDARLLDARGAVVRVSRASICGSDLHLYHADVPIVPGTVIGHECVGVVEEVGAEVQRFHKGDRVIVPGVVGCGACDPCRRGYVVGCKALLHKVYGVSPELGGAQAEAIAVPAADCNLWPSPDDLDDEQILFLTDILPTGFYAAANAGIEAGQTAVVIGCGPVGMAAILCARLRGAARVLAIDRVAERLEKAEDLGAEPIHAEAVDVRGAVMERTGGDGADAVIEAVGSTATVQLAFDLARIGGVVSVVGVLLDQKFPFPMATAFMKDLTFRIGLVNVPAFIPALLALVRSGRIDPRRLITHRLPLASGREAYEIFDKRREGCLKVVLAP